MKIGFSSRAKDDLFHIRTESARRVGHLAADRMLERIVRSVEKTLTNVPASGRARPELGPDIRSFPIAPLCAFYRNEAKAIVVLRILHGHRDIKEPLVSFLIAG